METDIVSTVGCGQRAAAGARDTLGGCPMLGLDSGVSGVGSRTAIEGMGAEASQGSGNISTAASVKDEKPTSRSAGVS